MPAPYSTQWPIMYGAKLSVIQPTYSGMSPSTSSSNSYDNVAVPAAGSSVSQLDHRRNAEIARQRVEGLAQRVRNRNAVGAAVGELGVALLAGQPDALDARQ